MQQLLTDQSSSNESETPATDTTPSLNVKASDTNLALQVTAALARRDFRSFRKLLRPDMLEGWFTDEIAYRLQCFYYDLIAGKRPKLALMSPPQHGKSWAAADFAAWVAGQNPNLQIIFASFSEELGRRTNRWMQRMLQDTNYKFVFSKLNVGRHGWECNTELIEFPEFKRSFRNTTVDGAINGMELNLGIIDDPLKGHQEANSPSIRNRTWNWYVSDFLSRFAANAGQLVIMTRWHVDDILGRALEQQKGWTVLKYPAVAEQREVHRYKVSFIRDNKIIEEQREHVRAVGEPLFSDLKPLDFLEQRKADLSQAGWIALYQQSPVIVGGGLLPIDKFQYVPSWDRTGIKRTVRYIDKAGTAGGGAYTAGVLMHLMYDGRYVISHVFRGQWSAIERENNIKTYAIADRKLYPNGYSIGIEQEPGSGGKESAEHTIRNLAGFNVFADKVTGAR